MARSVRARLLINSLLISLVTILAVGMVALLMLNSYFKEQERAYLRARANLFSSQILENIASNDRLALQRTVSLAGFTGQVRVQLLDQSGELVVDSGPAIDETIINPFRLEDPGLFIGAVVDERGQVIRFSAPISRQEDGQRGLILSLLEPSQLLDTPSSFTGISNERYELPLLYNDKIIGSLVLSEGPAVGEEIIGNIRRALVGGSFSALVLAALIGLLSANQVIRPLKALGTAVDEIGAGNLTISAPRSKLQEFDHLAEQFNHMSAHLSGTIKTLETEREILRETISNAGHELRTPLTALKTFNTLLSEEEIDNPQADKFIEESGRQIKQLEQLSADMLDLSRLEARLSGANFIDTDLRETVEAAVATLSPFREEKDITIILDLPRYPVDYPHDPGALQRAISNLYHNALKYTPSRGTIKVAIQGKDTSNLIVVEDSGPGIPDDIKPEIFKRYFRYPAHSESGSGLGLAISKEIVDIHGGQLQFDSDSQQGAVFIISLPIPSVIQGAKPDHSSSSNK